MSENKRNPNLATDQFTGPVRQLKHLCYLAFKKGDQVVQGKLDDGQYPNKNNLCRYNEMGAKTEEETINNLSGWSHIWYNDKGLTAEYIGIELDGKIGRKSHYSYSESGKMLQSISRKENGEVMFKTIYEYNEKDQLVKMTNFRANEKLDYIHTKYYDKDGHEIESKSVKEDGTIQSWDKREFNEHGDTISFTRLNPDGSINQFYEYHPEYDEEGNRIKVYRPQKEIQIYDYEYEYDSHGNWIKKIEYYRHVPVYMYLREIRYFGDEDEDIESVINKLHLQLLPGNKNEKKNGEAGFDEQSGIHKKTDPIAQLDEQRLKSVGAHCSLEFFSMDQYYWEVNRETPSSMYWGNMYTEAIALLKELQENMGAQIIHTINRDYGNGEQMVRYTLIFPNTRYILQAFQIQEFDEYEFNVPPFIVDSHKNREGYVYVSQLELLRPTKLSGKRDIEFENQLRTYVIKCTLEKAEEQPVINMVEMEENEYCLGEHNVDDDFIIEDLNLHYGEGFKDFHNELMQRFLNETKGLILFHGEPGTGKTYYIRHLLRSMAENNKKVIYMAPDMVENLLDPAFLTFLSQEVKYASYAKQFCVLLIEDAEPLLAARQYEGRVQGVSNLLNLTDGLLNDMLKVQIICTFNVKVGELDKALLRPGRLLARKEFRKLSAIDANLLASKLKVKHHFTKPVTIAEVFAKRKNKASLTHGIEEDDELEE
jgi:ATP-dependent 26S proteasome regulatory subunit